MIRFLVMITALGMFDPALAQPADVIVSGGAIYTMDAAQPQVEAVAARAGRIVFAGPAAGLTPYRGGATRTIDLHGAVALPGLVDAHAHLMNLGGSLATVQLVGTTSVEEVRRLVETAAGKIPVDEWVVGRGWDQNDWAVQEFPTADDLAGIPNPVYLKRVDGHAIWVNRRALDLCGITAETSAPEGGAIIRDASGRPSGVLIDHAKDLVDTQMPSPSRAEKTRRLNMALEACRRAGLVGVHDAGIDREDYEILSSLRERGELDFRVYGMLDVREDSVFCLEMMQAGPVVDDYVTVRAIKLYMDGALGSRGAALLAPYVDDPDNRGLFLTSEASFRAWAKRAAETGFQVCVHAIGDAGNRRALDVYEEMIERYGLKDHRWRIEHAQVVALEDIPRFGASGIIAAMQPTHCTSDMYWAETRIGPARILGAYAWRKMLDTGAVLALGSDFPVEAVNPLWGIYAAVTRQDHEGWPPGGWYPDQCLTIEEAVRGFTLDAAYAAFEERDRGTVTTGKLADLTVLDRDIFETAPREILDTHVVMTIIGGQVVFDAARSER